MRFEDQEYSARREREHLVQAEGVATDNAKRVHLGIADLQSFRLKKVLDNVVATPIVTVCFGRLSPVAELHPSGQPDLPNLERITPMLDAVSDS